MKKIIYVIFLFCILVISGCEDISENVSNSGEPNKLILGITSSKDIYKIGEPISGEFKIEYTGAPFKGIILYVHSRSGFNKKGYDIMRGTISSQTISLMKSAFQAFRLDETGYVGGADSFSNEGDYYYTLSVYDCATITSKLNKDCFNVEGEDLVTLNPLKTITKSIKVQGGASTFECKSNDDCKKTCIGCAEGIQKCEMVEQKCEDCFMDTQCKEGHKCRNKVCTEWQCDSDTNCNDNDASTKNICTNYKCVYTKITSCINSDLYCPANCNSDNDNDCEADKCGSQITNCGTNILVEENMGNMPNLDCFIDKAKDCCPAKLISELELNLFGILFYTKTYREIKSLENERCLVYSRIDDYSVRYPPETRQQMLDSGLTEEEINQKLFEYNQTVRGSMLGKYSNCNWIIDDLVNTLENEGKGIFSTEDQKGQCTGSMYE